MTGWLHAEIAKVEALLEFLNIEDRKFVKAQRLGKYYLNKTLLINTENPY